jgi:GTP cyclohydrolase II
LWRFLLCSFGSLWRCSKDLGGGIILYLTRRPRVGLVNNTRTYQLQRDGPNTFDANTTLAFDQMSAITASPHACFGC